MIEKIKGIFLNKDKKLENLISLLVILVITLIIINKIIEDEENGNDKDILNNESVVNTVEFAIEDINGNNLEERLENILESISGISNVHVMVTYSESNTIVPVYNINESRITEENKETVNQDKQVLVDESSNVITEKIINPKIEGAIITAKGASDSLNKSNIISAVEAVTGLAMHKIQVFEVGENK